MFGRGIRGPAWRAACAANCTRLGGKPSMSSGLSRVSAKALVVKDMIAKVRAEPGQFLLDFVKTLTLLALQAHPGQFGVAAERVDDTPLR